MFCVGVGCCSTPPKQGIRLENAKSRTKVEEDKSPQVRRLQCSSTTLFHGQIKYNLQQPFCSFRPTLAVSNSSTQIVAIPMWSKRPLWNLKQARSLRTLNTSTSRLTLTMCIKLSEFQLFFCESTADRPIQNFTYTGIQLWI